jgi:hypothetical protein
MRPLLPGPLAAAALFVGCAQPPAPTAAPPHAALDALDDRRPLPLLPPMALHQKANMRGHLESVQRIVDGLAAEDWPAVEDAAAALGTSPQMAQTCDHLGAGAEGFTAQALDFHRRADAISAAARARDAAATLQATSDTLRACTACHATWRQQLVTPDAYAEAIRRPEADRR